MRYAFTVCPCVRSGRPELNRRRGAQCHLRACRESCVDVAGSQGDDGTRAGAESCALQNVVQVCTAEYRAEHCTCRSTPQCATPGEPALTLEACLGVDDFRREGECPTLELHRLEVQPDQRGVALLLGRVERGDRPV